MGVENEGFRELKQGWHLDQGFLHHPTGIPVLWALSAAGFDLFELFLARRIRKRNPPEGDRPLTWPLGCGRSSWSGRCRWTRASLIPADPAVGGWRKKPSR